MTITSTQHLGKHSDKPSTSVKPSSGQGNPYEGSVYTLVCAVFTWRPDAIANHFTWWRNGIQLNDNSSTISFFLDHTQHDGNYTCSATNTAGQGEQSDGYQLKVYCEYNMLNISLRTDVNAGCSVCTLSLK